MSNKKTKPTTKLTVNSSENQRIKEMFVKREVIANVTDLVEYILKVGDNSAPFTIDDIQNIDYPVCKYCSSDKVIWNDDESVWHCPHCGKDSENCDHENREIYEWYLVQEWLYNKLAEQGETVMTDGYYYYWGRGITAQAILLDGVISRICSEMEILTGQKNEWKVE